MVMIYKYLHAMDDDWINYVFVRVMFGNGSMTIDPVAKRI